MSDVVWQGLTGPGLDQQLNLRARWPGHQAVLDRWAESSAAVRAALPPPLELAYGAHPLQRIDLHPLAREGAPAPLLVFIHGGYWQGLDKSDFSFLVPTFLEAGIAVASVNYRMAPEVRMAEIAADITAALDLLQEAAPAQGCAPDFVLSGHSAGGHLAVLELVRERLAVAAGTMAARTRACCSISGVYDLAPIRHSYQQPVLRVAEREVAELSPLRRAPASAPPLLLALGEWETAEFVRQQNAMAAHWQALDLPVESRRVPEADHFTVVDALSAADHPLTRWLLRACLAGDGRRDP